MSRSITLGQYFPGHSMVHCLNPRMKLLSLLLVLVLLFSLQTYLGLAVLFSVAFVLILTTRVPIRYFLRGLRPVLYIAFFALVIYFFFTSGGVVLLRVGFITVESEGVREGLFIILRLVSLVFFSLLLTLTTTPLSLTHGLGYFLRPLRYIGLPTEEVAMIMAIALRFIPTLMEESQRLMRAQVSRGADFESGSILRRAKSLIPLIVPLFVSAFRRADELALAMEARGYRIGARRTRIHEDSIAPRDWAALGIVSGLLVASLVLGL